MVAEAVLTVRKGSETRKLEYYHVSEGMDKSLMKVTAPSKEKHFSQLRIGSDIWKYIPKSEQIHRMAHSELQASWMGSDISYQDLIRHTQYSKNYRLTKIGEERLNGLNCYKILATPPAGEKESEKMLIWISVSHHSLVRQEVYGVDRKLSKRLDSKKFEKIGNYVVPTHFEIRSFPSRAGDYTELEYRKIILNGAISDRFFTQIAMKTPVDRDTFLNRMISGSRSARR